MEQHKICTFFGHRQVETNILPKLETAIRQMIEMDGITTFWCGNKGEFDRIAANTVHRLKSEYPQIELILVYAYPPKDKMPEIYDASIYPEGLETVPQRFAVSKRNQWMAFHCDTVISYINHAYGGAFSAYHTAQKKGKKIVNLGDL